MSTISNILSHFEDYKELELKNRFFKHGDIEKLIHKLSKNELFHIEKIGESFEKRPLYLLKTGQGSTKVFLWSQMHGNEPTATMALFDIFNFFQQKDQFDELRQTILKNCTLYFLPMVNPDGSELFTRQNAQGIDINRDFHRQQTPEGRILRTLRDQINPHFGFNLHDQSIRWSAGDTGNPATISLLAPAFDRACSINEVRLNAIQIIAGIHEELQVHAPHHIGRFDDEHESRAFGDNFQQAGTSTILVESGGYPDDWEKQFTRKLVFGALLSGLEQIASNSYQNRTVDEYFQIPENSKKHYSYVLRNCTLCQNNQFYTVDIGLIAEETWINEKLEQVYKIEGAGDLTGFHGYEEFDLTDVEIILKSQIFPDNLADLTATNAGEIILSFENGKIIHKKI